MSEEKEQEQIQDPAEKYVGQMDKILSFKREKDLNIYQRIHKVMEEVWYIQKEGNTGQFETVEHDDVTRKVRPSLVKHGIAVKIHEINVDEVRVVPIQKYNRQSNEHYEETQFLCKATIIARFINIDDPEDFVDTPSFGLELDKQPMTISGKIMSYAFKYCVLKTLFLETGEREDAAILKKEEMDLNAVWMYNTLGEELFGDDWEKMGKQKIYKITGGQTAEASRAPVGAVNEAIRNLYTLKKEKEENPDKDIQEINEEVDEKRNEESGNDILNDFKD